MHPLAYDLCDEHEWAGIGDCPQCLEEYAEQMARIRARQDEEYFERQRRELAQPSTVYIPATVITADHI